MRKSFKSWISNSLLKQGKYFVLILVIEKCKQGENLLIRRVAGCYRSEFRTELSFMKHLVLVIKLSANRVFCP